MARRPSSERRGKYTTVSIPTPLFERIRALIEGTGFTSVSQFVTYVLREVVSDMEKQKAQAAVSEEEKKEIIERLRSLGYI
ncbi:MAG: ribbon-helix-helix domain-containing protein [Acidilobus sp.]|nr:ribbon-helix-helix domain-containing protein [Acidilobus sp.]MCG2890290.1 ribbon-helix-helix domain-containing protein [Acidilobus sp.]MCG2891162.1 ribbon-helix-helix domain-containing protein [Acidilobus sp.]